jgi:hypothetical protein
MHIKLCNAYLCAGCDSISDSPEQCPDCGDRLGLLPLITILNRTQKAVMLPKELRRVYVFRMGEIQDGIYQTGCLVEGSCLMKLFKLLYGEPIWSGYASDQTAALMAAKE